MIHLRGKNRELLGLRVRLARGGFLDFLDVPEVPNILEIPDIPEVPEVLRVSDFLRVPKVSEALDLLGPPVKPRGILL